MLILFCSCASDTTPRYFDYQFRGVKPDLTNSSGEYFDNAKNFMQILRSGIRNNYFNYFATYDYNQQRVMGFDPLKKSSCEYCTYGISFNGVSFIILKLRDLFIDRFLQEQKDNSLKALVSIVENNSFVLLACDTSNKRIINFAENSVLVPPRKDLSSIYMEYLATSDFLIFVHYFVDGKFDSTTNDDLSYNTCLTIIDKRLNAKKYYLKNQAVKYIEQKGESIVLITNYYKYHEYIINSLFSWSGHGIESVKPTKKYSSFSIKSDLILRKEKDFKSNASSSKSLIEEYEKKRE